MKRHVFVCINQRPPNHPMGCCQSKGSIELIQALNESVSSSELAGHTAVAGTTCLGPCNMGPSIAVYPEGVWYSNVTPGDIPELVEEHLRNGRPVERLRLKMPNFSAGG
ncbi:MAG: (2Fe-2S) ferredoxin domain-containing protein [bacterium]|nr:(2Fe-2S) ferredoxin domain-containing protein [bacterium]